MAAPEETSFDVDPAQVLRVVLRRRWIILTGVVVGAAVAAAVNYVSVPIYTATTMVLIEKERSTATPADAVRVDSTAEDYYHTQYRILKSRSLMRQVYDDLNLQNVSGFQGPGGVDALNSMIKVAPIPRSRLVNISADSPSPEMAARVVNALATRYVAQNIENKLYISKEIYQTLFPKEGDPPLSAEEQDSRFSNVPAVVNNPLIQSLKGTHADLQVRLGQTSQRYTPEHPQMLRLRAEMDAIRRTIRQETARIIEGMRAELSGQLLGNNVRIIDRAETPKSPSRPNTRRTLLAGLGLGLAAGLLMAFLIDMIDQRIYSQEDVEVKLSLPFLGSVPKAPMSTGDIIQDYSQLLTGPESLTGESLKNIRTMLGFAAVGKEMKRLLITSTTQGEGKTFIAINLAATFAHLGEKVLLIEGDLRRPNLHRRLGLSNERGLSHFLAHGRDVSEIGGMIQDTSLANLKVLVCGPIPPNPAELLSTPRVKALLAWAVENYDHVFIDGTPVFPITDVLLWGHWVDATVFVVKFGSVHAKLAAKARRKLHESGLKMAGAVVNHVTWKSRSYYYYYYSDYYYHYYSSYYTDSERQKAKQGEPVGAKQAGT